MQAVRFANAGRGIRTGHFVEIQAGWCAGDIPFSSRYGNSVFSTSTGYRRKRAGYPGLVNRIAPDPFRPGDTLIGRLGVDFGATTTIIAAKDESGAEVSVIRLDGRSCPRSGAIPSVVHYGTGGTVTIGQETIDRGVHDSPSTIRWMRHYLIAENPVRVPRGDGMVSYREAGRDFLLPVLKAAVEETGCTGEIVFSIPADAPGSYRDWIAAVASEAGISRFRLIDEPTAAAYGYGFSPAPGDIWAVADLGDSAFEVTIVLAEPFRDGKGTFCRVLGKAADDFGGHQIDLWFARELSGTRENGSPVPSGFLAACRAAREDLSIKESIVVNVPGTGERRVTKEDLDNALCAHEFAERVGSTIQRAVDACGCRGFSPGQIGRVFLVGGGGSMPIVGELCEQRFGKEKVFRNRPCDAIARGAACFDPAAGLLNQIQHDYAVRFWNPVSRTHEFRTIIRKGTKFPVPGGVARLAIKASYDGQIQLGLPVFEGVPPGGDEGGGIELIAGPAGGFRILEERNGNERNYRWINENEPPFIPADPPAMKGIVRFEITFNIDGNKRLLVTVRDLLTGSIVRENYPVARLR